MTREELRTAILYFDISRAKTSLNAVQGVITREQADARLEFDVASLLESIDRYTAEKVLEGKIEENNMWLAQYRGASKRLTSDGYTASTTEVVANSFEPRIDDLQAELSKLKEEE